MTLSGFFIVLAFLKLPFTNIKLRIQKTTKTKLRKKLGIKKIRWKLIISIIGTYFFIFVLLNYLCNIFQFPLLQVLPGTFITLSVVLAFLKLSFTNIKRKKEKKKKLKKEKTKLRTHLSVALFPQKSEKEKAMIRVFRWRLIFAISYGVFIYIGFIYILVYQHFEWFFVYLQTGICLTLFTSYLNSKYVKNWTLFNKIESKEIRLTVKFPQINKKYIISYIIKSLLKHFLIFFGLLTLFFFIIDQMPILGPPRLYPPPDWYSSYFDWRNLPLLQKYLSYLQRLFTGEWGISITFYPSTPITELILEGGSTTLIISVLPLCIWGLYHIFKNPHLRFKISRKIILLGISIPSFVIGCIFFYVLRYWHWNVDNEISLILASTILSITALCKIFLIKNRTEINNNTRVGFSRETFFISIMISEIILIESICNLDGLGSLLVGAFTLSDFFLNQVFLFLLSILVVSLLFTMSLKKLYYQIISKKGVYYP